MTMKKHAEVLQTLQGMIKASAEEVQTTVTGEPKSDPKKESVPASTETVDKNNVDPKHNTPQVGEQKDSPTEAKVLENAKAGSDELAKMAKEIVDAAMKAASDSKKHTEVQGGATGVAGDHPKIESVSAKNDNVDKNKVEPQSLPQNYTQKPSTDKSEPIKHATEVEKEQDLQNKIASFELGRQLAMELINSAGSKQAAELCKDAGRKDMDLMIAEAAANLTEEQKKEKVGAALFDEVNTKAAQEKQAEEAGRQMFDELFKQAQMEHLAAENANLKEEVKKLEQHEKAEHGVDVTKHPEFTAEKGPKSEKCSEVKPELDMNAIAMKVAELITANLKKDAAK